MPFCEHSISYGRVVHLSVCLSICLSVCLSDTRCFRVKTTQDHEIFTKDSSHGGKQFIQKFKRVGSEVVKSELSKENSQFLTNKSRCSRKCARYNQGDY